jgi:hypothetical protein
MAALPDDINIWNHQKYLDSPALATSEAAGFRKLRRWAQGFYPESRLEHAVSRAPRERAREEVRGRVMR